MFYFWLAVFIASLLFILIRRPKQKMAWCPEHSREAKIKIHAGKVKIYNFVNVKYKGPLDPEKVTHSVFAFNLDQLKAVYILLEEFSVGLGRYTFTPAHLFLSFELDDGRFFSISVAGRRLKNEKVTFKRVLPHYKEIFYKVIDEKDTIIARACFENDPLYIFPLKANKEQAQKVFLDMADKINKLSEKAEWFDTFSKNCTTEAVKHLRRSGIKLPAFSVKYILTNSFYELLFKKYFLDLESKEDIKRVYELKDFICKHKNDPDLSAKLREEIKRRLQNITTTQ